MTKPLSPLTDFLGSFLKVLLTVFCLTLVAYGIAVACGLLNLPGWEAFENPLIAACLMVVVVCMALISLTRVSSTHYNAYQVHRTLLEIEISLTEMFNRLRAKGVDKRRDRMVTIMKEAELCKHNPTASIVMVSNKDRGASQETARSIIEHDKNDLAGFRAKRSNARINAFAYEAIINGQFRAARSHILEKHLEAIARGKETPVILNGIRKLLKLPSIMAEDKVREELERETPLGVFPASIHLAIKYWRHPRNLVFRNEELEARGAEALKAMRLF